MEVPQNLKAELPDDLAIPLLGIYPRTLIQKQNVLLYFNGNQWLVNIVGLLRCL